MSEPIKSFDELHAEMMRNKEQATIAEAVDEKLTQDEAQITQASGVVVNGTTDSETNVTDTGVADQEQPQDEVHGEAPAVVDGVSTNEEVETPEISTNEPTELIEEPAVDNAAPAVVAPIVPEPTPVILKPALVAAQQAEAMEGFGAVGRRVMSILQTYAEQMAPRKPVSDAKIIEQQTLLYEAMTKMINDSGDDFEPLMKKVLAFFEEHKSGVFHEVRIFRGMSAVPLSANDRNAFQALLNLFKLVANPQSRPIALKQVDLVSSLQFGVTENGRNRVIGFFEQ